MVEVLTEETMYDKATEAIQTGISEGLNEVAKYILSQARQYILEKEIYDTGKLSQTADVDLSDPMSKIVYFKEKHAPFMEFGTGPAAEEAQPKYLPPLEPLIDWCRRKGIKFESVNYEKGGGGSYRARTLSYEETAQAIRWHIYHYGIDPRPFFRPAIHDGEVKKAPTIKRYVDKSLRGAGLRASDRIR